METATLGGGCFWCTEAIFQRLKGVSSVVSGYSGGDMDKPNYDQVSSGKTGHAEVIQINFDPKLISYSDILEVFFKTHDPTTMNQQGADIGTQYRSVIFYHDDKQKSQAEELIKKLATNYSQPIVTQLKPFTNFYQAENYHQDYYNLNHDKPYCQLVIDPKIQKLYKEFKDKVKES